MSTGMTDTKVNHPSGHSECPTMIDIMDPTTNDVLMTSSVSPSPSPPASPRRSSMVLSSSAAATRPSLLSPNGKLARRRSSAMYRSFVLNGLDLALEEDDDDGGSEEIEFEGSYQWDFDSSRRSSTMMMQEDDAEDVQEEDEDFPSLQAFAARLNPKLNNSAGNLLKRPSRRRRQSSIYRSFVLNGLDLSMPDEEIEFEEDDDDDDDDEEELNVNFFSSLNPSLGVNDDQEDEEEDFDASASSGFSCGPSLVTGTVIEDDGMQQQGQQKESKEEIKEVKEDPPPCEEQHVEWNAPFAITRSPSSHSQSPQETGSHASPSLDTTFCSADGEEAAAAAATMSSSPNSINTLSKALMDWETTMPPPAKTRPTKVVPWLCRKSTKTTTTTHPVPAATNYIDDDALDKVDEHSVVSVSNNGVLDDTTGLEATMPSSGTSQTNSAVDEDTSNAAEWEATPVLSKTLLDWDMRTYVNNGRLSSLMPSLRRSSTSTVTSAAFSGSSFRSLHDTSEHGESEMKASTRISDSLLLQTKVPSLNMVPDDDREKLKSKGWALPLAMVVLLFAAFAIFNASVSPHPDITPTGDAVDTFQKLQIEEEAARPTKAKSTPKESLIVPTPTPKDRSNKNIMSATSNYVAEDKSKAKTVPKAKSESRKESSATPNPTPKDRSSMKTTSRTGNYFAEEDSHVQDVPIGVPMQLSRQDLLPSLIQSTLVPETSLIKGTAPAVNTATVHATDRDQPTAEDSSDNDNFDDHNHHEDPKNQWKDRFIHIFQFIQRILRGVWTSVAALPARVGREAKAVASLVVAPMIQLNRKVRLFLGLTVHQTSMAAQHANEIARDVASTHARIHGATISNLGGSTLVSAEAIRLAAAEKVQQGLEIADDVAAAHAKIYQASTKLGGGGSLKTLFQGRSRVHGAAAASR